MISFGKQKTPTIKKIKNKDKNKCKKMTNNDNNNNNKMIKTYIPFSPPPPVHRLNNPLNDDDDELCNYKRCEVESIILQVEQRG